MTENKRTYWQQVSGSAKGLGIPPPPAPVVVARPVFATLRVDVPPAAVNEAPKKEEPKVEAQPEATGFAGEDELAKLQALFSAMESNPRMADVIARLGEVGELLALQPDAAVVMAEMMTTMVEKMVNMAVNEADREQKAKV